jgi:hypothetical protein
MLRYPKLSDDSSRQANDIELNIGGVQKVRRERGERDLPSLL